MNVNQLIYRNLKKNLKNYYLYVFALIFSAALYFAFVTLQYDPSMDAVKGTIKGGASVRAASILLIAIVSIFLVYANAIFIKRRSKEIGLFQLIGLTKGKIFRLLSLENFLLYYSSLAIGLFVGFSFSKLIMMILFKTTGVDNIASLHFSMQAFSQTLIVFSAIYVLILVMNALFIKRQSILSLFRVTSTAEAKIKKLTRLEMIMGALGFLLIGSGYYVSSKLFEGDFVTMMELFGAMAFILAAVILGTYFFYKGSVSYIFHFVRRKKDGYLSINEVLSLSSIMFRMKSNALLLTIITTVSALAIGLLSLSYIAYYSAEKTAENNIPADFSLTGLPEAEQFKQSLTEQQIPYRETIIEVVQVTIDGKSILDGNTEGLNVDPSAMPLPIISDQALPDMDVAAGETYLTGYNDLMQKFMPLKTSGKIELKGKTEVVKQKYLGLKKEYPISWYFTNGGIPVAIVDETVFQRLKQDKDPKVQKKSSHYVGIHINEERHQEKANQLFLKLGLNKADKGLSHESQLEMSQSMKRQMGLIMFIVGFLGLTFLITSGCILYFKQMDESENEKPNYTILRKLGFTRQDLLKGIQYKQVYNFGIPLAIGLLHSYFAVQSGWFLFGTAVWTPMILVMVIYTVLYSIFGVLSVLYYKKVIRDSL
ncbi:bacitracin transport system permease protein [Bacillus ectoiniformans]|uniref:ABC transporter permease n=1 Tax=Bacillus ectoiniformans TaxID=1494429 RepID=UPI0019597361|nr:ABC transporter permease [Bacillus ectoiniformans]MBM7648202.1 bacitracin transport system permease protein [Bacillus ectoiniformans]